MGPPWPQGLPAAVKPLARANASWPAPMKPTLMVCEASPAALAAGTGSAGAAAGRDGAGSRGEVRWAVPGPATPRGPVPWPGAAASLRSQRGSQAGRGVASGRGRGAAGSDRPSPEPLPRPVLPRPGAQVPRYPAHFAPPTAPRGICARRPRPWRPSQSAARPSGTGQSRGRRQRPAITSSALPHTGPRPPALPRTRARLGDRSRICVYGTCSPGIFLPGPASPRPVNPACSPPAPRVGAEGIGVGSGRSLALRERPGAGAGHAGPCRGLRGTVNVRLASPTAYPEFFEFRPVRPSKPCLEANQPFFFLIFLLFLEGGVGWRGGRR